MMNYHAFSVGQASYVYSPGDRQAYRLNREDVDILNDRSPSSVRRRLDVLEYLSAFKNPYTSGHVPRQYRYALYLNLATTCNLHCVYCFAQSGTYGEPEELMAYPTAQKAIKRFLEIVPPDTVAYLIYFGGEPLLAWETLTKAFAFASQEAESTGKQIRHHVVTNGTLLTKEKVNFFVKHKIDVVVSIDGEKDLHDRQRPLRDGKPSFHLLKQNLSYFFTKVTQSAARATYIDLDYPLYQVYRDLFRMGFHTVDTAPDFLHLDTVGFSRLCSQIEELKEDVLEFLLQHGYIGHSQFLDRIRRIFSGAGVPPDGCGAGDRITSVAPNGRFYACHRFTGMNDFAIGDVHNGYDHSRHPIAQADCSSCKICWNRFACSSGCFFNNQVINGNAATPISSWCSYSKKMTEVTLSIIEQIPKEILMRLIVSEVSTPSLEEVTGKNHKLNVYLSGNYGFIANN
ncbi:radical SAM protein [Desulfovibrionaceae bacterium CB1MN]|uniref:radical SAM protein n=1 Tax=Hydrosulfovibrio ferrireducens TaxID=2934181 RepID=UPI003ABB90E2